MLFLVGLLFIAFTVLGAARWMRAPKVPPVPFLVLGLVGFAACVGILLIADMPPPQMPVFQEIEPGAWPRAGLVGDLAYYGFLLSLWLVSLGTGVGLGAMSQSGGAKRAVALTIGLIAIPVLFVAWVFGPWIINCSYAFSQIGHACY